MFTRMLYGAAAIWLLFSFCKDREKTMAALKKAWRSFENILPSMLTVLLLLCYVFLFRHLDKKDRKPARRPELRAVPAAEMAEKTGYHLTFPQPLRHEETEERDHPAAEEEEA